MHDAEYDMHMGFRTCMWSCLGQELERELAAAVREQACVRDSALEAIGADLTAGAAAARAALEAEAKLEAALAVIADAKSVMHAALLQIQSKQAAAMEAAHVGKARSGTFLGSLFASCTRFPSICECCGSPRAADATIRYHCVPVRSCNAVRLGSVLSRLLLYARQMTSPATAAARQRASASQRRQCQPCYRPPSPLAGGRFARPSSWRRLRRASRSTASGPAPRRRSAAAAAPSATRSRRRRHVGM